MKLYKIIIGILLMSLVVAGMLVFFTGGNTAYAPSSYNDTALQEFQDTFSEINATMTETYAQVNQTQSDKDIPDIFGNLFNQVFGAAKITAQSMGTLDKVVDVGVSNTPFLGSFGGTLKIMLYAIIFAAITIGIIMYFVTGRERN